MKLTLSFAVAAAVAAALITAPAEAATKKKGSKARAQATEVTVSKPSSGFWASQHNACVSAGSGWWFPIAATNAVGCSAVYAVPVIAEGFFWPYGV